MRCERPFSLWEKDRMRGIKYEDVLLTPALSPQAGEGAVSG